WRGEKSRFGPFPWVETLFCWETVGKNLDGRDFIARRAVDGTALRRSGRVQVQLHHLTGQSVYHVLIILRYLFQSSEYWIFK
ncbi:hypothetical protein CHARACLAT_015907, partial [Characodon lateralis]|nr:hypothetical protein [Characodon lateralis]